MIKLLLPFALATCLGCQQKKEETDFTPPTNRASQLEQSKIDAALTDIDQIFKEYGRTIHWADIPIVVNETELSGYCQRDHDGNGRYIVLSSSAVDLFSDPQRAPWHWGTLLHEIGHCFLRLEHHNENLFVRGYVFDFYEGDETEFPLPLTYPFVPVSIMSSNSEILIPLSLRKYYVAELLGLTRATGIEDLKKFSQVELRRQ